MKRITSINSFESSIKSHKMVMMYFANKSCGVCHSLLPKVKQLVSEQFPLIKFGEIEISDHPEISAQNGVFMAPTLLLFTEGKEQFRWSRNFSIQEINDSTKRVYNILF